MTIWIVVSIGTLVNKLCASSDPRSPCLRLTFKISINSSEDLSEYVFGTYGAISAFRDLAVWYEAVGTCDMIGRNGLSCLWVLTLP